MRGFWLATVFAHDAHELLVFDAPELRLAHAGKNFGDRKSGGFGDALVEINVRPAQLPRDEAPGGGLAAAHEAGEADRGGAGEFR